jgi:hypothetical protein
VHQCHTRIPLSLAERLATTSLVELVHAQFLGDLDATDDDADSATRAIVSAVAKKNQFVGFDPRFEAGIAREVQTLFAALAIESARAEAIANATTAIARVMREALGDPPREVTAATYSPELQLAVLSLAPDDMRAPILDVGCGENAALVRWLRAKNKDARGLDRECPEDLVALGVGTRGDWLAFDYGAARWGTITSHLGFSLHFMHQEMKRSELAFEYARTYMRVVRALAPGGTFAYVPGLPFIEAMLPRELAVETVPLAKDLVTENVARVQETTGLVLDAATHVTRRPSR